MLLSLQSIFRYVTFLIIAFAFAGVAYAAPFVSTWDTTLVSTGSSVSGRIVLPITGSKTVDWGDGTIDTLSSHTYVGTPTSVTISITGTGGGITGFRFNNSGDRLKIKNISQWGDLKLGNSTGYFYGAANLKITATDTLNTTGTTDMRSAFRSSGIDTVPNMGSWNMSAVTNMGNMFQSATSFNENI